jgi:hypothetical protein
MSEELPMQPIFVDEEGTCRFRQNHIVRFMLDAGPFDLNQLSCLPNIPREDWEQFAQLIGYSINGFGELSYVSEESYEKAEAEADQLLKGDEDGH